MLFAFLLLSFSILFSNSIAQLTDAATLGASIKFEAGYSLLPNCINQCVWDIGDNDANKIGGDLAIHLSCGSPWVNGCFCRGESAAYAYSFLTSCFGYLCTTPAAKDIDAGISVYTSYCSAALGAAYTPNAVPEPAPADGISTVLSTATRGAATSHPTSTIPQQTSLSTDSFGPTGTESANTNANTSNSNSKDDNKIAGLTRGAFIGIVISASCSILGLLFGIGFKVYKHKKQMRLQQQSLEKRGYYQSKF